MADFVAVLKKTIEGLSENTPDVRAKVYAKARATIDAKLAAINPPPPAAVAQRQRQAIEDAIAAVEQSYAPPEPVDDDDLDSFFQSYNADHDADPEPSLAAAPQAAARSGLPRADEFSAGPAYEDEAEEHRDTRALDDEDLPGSVIGDEPRERDFDDAEPQRRRFSGAALAALLALLVIGGGAYAAWTNQDALVEVLGLSGASEVAEGTDLPEEEAVSEDVAATEPLTAAESEAQGIVPIDPPVEGQTDVAALAPEEGAQAAEPQPDPVEEAAPAAEAPDAAAAEPVRKYTQQLQADGSEIDPGPANGGLSIGEGTSVAELTQTAQADLAAPAGIDPATAPVSQTAPAAPAADGAQQVAVGQRAIFYEERTSTAAATAESGSIVWSVVQESPGGDAAPEAAIRAEAVIPGKDLQLRMTIRRNADPTLPASHIMEMIFLTPEGFEGGGIQNVVRVALKDSEQATGSPLLGIPAKIADGFFLVALSDSPAEIQANMTLLRRQNWIDVPLIYTSGRRALITMEKGVPGERVFEDVMKAWQDASSG